jgi:hypothetical protein
VQRFYLNFNVTLFSLGVDINAKIRIANVTFYFWHFNFDSESELDFRSALACGNAKGERSSAGLRPATLTLSPCPRILKTRPPNPLDFPSNFKRDPSNFKNSNPKPPRLPFESPSNFPRKPLGSKGTRREILTTRCGKKRKSLEYWGFEVPSKRPRNALELPLDF